MKTYEVTLARLAWIKGSVTVLAESWEDAFAKAKALEDQADWPIDESGDVVIGFGDVEIDSAYCPSESEGHHEGEAPAADVMVYKAAPQLASALETALERLEMNNYSNEEDEFIAVIKAALASAGL